MQIGTTTLSADQLKAQSVHGIPTKIILHVQDLIDQANNGTLAPNTALEDIAEICLEEGLLKEETFPVDDFMCHPCNRSKLGLNGSNVHKNGLSVDSVGVDLKELSNGKSMAFEVCPLEPAKSFQVQFNRHIIKQANGLLADLSGKDALYQ